MTIPLALIVGALMGLVFGIALEKSRVFEPGMILGQMQLRNFIMLKIFLTAVATGLFVLAALNGFGMIKLGPKATIYGADIVGGAILGVGIALAGACPGTVMAQIGAGYRDAWLTLLGGLAGALTFIYLEPTLNPILLTGGPGKLTFDGLLGVPYWSAALVVAVVLIGALVGLERWRPWRQELGPACDGYFGPPSGTTAPPAAARRPIAAA